MKASIFRFAPRPVGLVLLAAAFTGCSDDPVVAPPAHTTLNVAGLVTSYGDEVLPNA